MTTPPRTVGSTVVQPLLTDLYQISMAYAYWKADKRSEIASFEIYFRRSPFQGEFTIFAGLEECLRFLADFRYSDSDIEYLKKILPSNVEPEFFEFMAALSPYDVTIYAIDEGTVVFPRVPLIRVEGPIITCQILETTFLTLVNYASLITTNATRYRLAAGYKMKLYEFGLRRAQGPDGGLSASKYSYLGGFDGTSNVLAGKLYDIPVVGTHAHSFVTSFSSLSDLTHAQLLNLNTSKLENLLDSARDWRVKVAPELAVCHTEASDGELVAFVSYALSFPSNFAALIDTYDVKKSGVLNFCAVGLALNDFGYVPRGVRLDSGDLAYLSIYVRSAFKTVARAFNVPIFEHLLIMASNDINEATILCLNDQEHSINSLGIGTHLVTCERQPALGCVYKMVELKSQPRMKLSQEVEKVTIPCRKEVYRLYGTDGNALIDLMQKSDEEAPKVNERVLCRHPFQESKRAYVVASKVERLLKVYWQNGRITLPLLPLSGIRDRVLSSLNSIRNDIKRSLNPTPYKVSVSEELYKFLHDLWLKNAPIGELS